MQNKSKKMNLTITNQEYAKGLGRALGIAPRHREVGREVKQGDKMWIEVEIDAVNSAQDLIFIKIPRTWNPEPEFAWVPRSSLFHKKQVEIHQ